MNFQKETVKFLCVLFTLLVCQVEMKGQYVEWYTTIGGTKRQICRGISQTNDGGYIIKGETTSFDGDFEKNHGYYDFFAAKLDKNGKKEWIKTYGGSEFDQMSSGYGLDKRYNTNIILDKGYILGGSSGSSNSDFSQNNGLADICAIRVDQFGNKLWARNFGGSGHEFCAGSFSTSSKETYLFGTSNSNDGDFAQGANNRNISVIKIDSMGKKIWAKKFGGDIENEPRGSLYSKDNNIYLLGVIYKN